MGNNKNKDNKTGQRGNVTWGKKSDGSGSWWSGTDENGTKRGGWETFRKNDDGKTEHYGHFSTDSGKGKSDKITPGDKTNVPQWVKDVQKFADDTFDKQK